MGAGGEAALVVGAGAIGAATARLLAAGGGAVTVADRDLAAAQRVAAPLGGRALALDLDDPDAAAAAVAALPQALSALVNAAGVAERDGQRLDAGAWGRLLRVNLVAPVLLAEAAAERMAPGGAIVNVCSIAGRSVLASSGAPTPAYAASKAGLEHATRALAVSLARRGVRVNALAPGFAHTPMTAQALASDGAWIAARTPLRRLVEPAEVAAAAAFLLSGGASAMTGATLVVDGGLTLGLLRADGDGARR